ncbi:hypothetical protein MHH96_01250 [Niallia sp. FSL K6-0212]|uniref:hypothetical protein n=1 Tax=Niallia sp. FSL K6-0212 TaxID=2921423 RepID=UPI0030FACA27
MNFTVTVDLSPKFEKAILLFASVLGGQAAPSLQGEGPAKVQDAPVNNVAPIQQPAQQAPLEQQPASEQPQYQQAPPVQQAQPVQQPPVQQQQPAVTPGGVPTTAPAYSMEDLARASTQLMDAGKQQDLLNLLAQFGAQSLMQVPQEQYGAFATKLRELGAKI